MPNNWNITSVETEGDNTHICGISPDGKSLLVTVVRRMNNAMLESLPNMWVKKGYNKHNKSRCIIHCGSDLIYVISVNIYDSDSLNMEYYQDNIFSDSEVIITESNFNETCDNWSKLQNVNIEDAFEKNVVCKKSYLGLPDMVLYMDWHGQVTAGDTY